MGKWMKSFEWYPLWLNWLGTLKFSCLQTYLLSALTVRYSALSCSEPNSLSFSISLGFFVFSLLSLNDNNTPPPGFSCFMGNLRVTPASSFSPTAHNIQQYIMSNLWQESHLYKFQPVSSEPSYPHSKASTLAYKDVNKHKSSLRTV